jgi:trehalose 6-phosphate phosphatase
VSTAGDALLAPFRAQPARSVIACDFDGTLSAIVDEPADADLIDGARAVLSSLADRYEDVIVISGRPVSFLRTRVPNDVSLVGLYGLEGVRHGARWEHPNGGAWREVIADLAALAAASGPPGVRVEPKDLSLTLHYRGAPELEGQVLAFATTLAERAGLGVRPARMSVELHPPIRADKGTSLERFAARAQVALFAGDDLGDLPAFDALDRLATRGVQVMRVAVDSAEAPEELIERADLVVDGPGGFLDVLSELAAAS